MATAENAKLQIETGQTFNAMAVMTDAGDHQLFTITGGTIWSGKSGFEPDVKPSGMVSGLNVLSIHATNDTITIAAFTANSKGVLKTVTATTDTISRTATATVSQVHAVTMASDGSIAVVEGVVGATQAFSETRAAAGGPPEIPATSVEIGQIRVTTSTPAALVATEIFQVPGTHSERHDYPIWEEYNIGDGDNADSAAQKNAYIKFASALSAIHTTATYKEVYMSYYAPIFSKVAKCFDFTPCDQSHSVSSQQIYGGTVASTSKTLNQGGFTALMSDGISDSIIREQDEVSTVRFYPDENKTPYILTQGVLGMARSYPADNQVQADVTLSAESKSANFSS